MTTVSDDLAEFWFWLPLPDRRALCALARVDRWVPERQWSELATHEKMALVRAMLAVGELADECAQALAGTWRAIQEQATRATPG